MIKEDILKAAECCTSPSPCSECQFINRSAKCTAIFADFIVKNFNKAETIPALSAHETVNHPAHYQGKHECIDEMIALFGIDAVKAFCKCNVYKYRYRSDKKDGPEDISKAEWYMDKLMELEKDSEDTGTVDFTTATYYK